MFELLTIILFCLFFGVLPVFLFFKKNNIDNKTSLAIAIGFSPVLLAIINILIVLVGIEDHSIKYLVLCLPFVFLYKEFFYLIKNLKTDELLLPILFSLIAGTIFCFIAFSQTFNLIQPVYSDVEFNFGLVQELKHHFLPHDPHWSIDKFFIYHFNGNIFLASISNFLEFNIVSIYNYANIYIALSVFVIIGLIPKKKNVVACLLIVLVYFLFSYTNEWVLFNSFHSHISDCASTFYWSLPVFFSSYVLWKYLNKNRNTINLLWQALMTFLLVWAIVFSKSSSIVIFALVELFTFILFIVENKIYSVKKIKEQFRILISFIFLPLFSIFFLWLISKSLGDKFYFGLEDRDIIYFQSWSFVYPVFLLFGYPVILSLLSLNNRNKGIWIYLIVGLLNLLLFFITLHEGEADLYFGFNVFLMIIIYLIEVDTDYKIIKAIIAYSVSYLIFLWISPAGVKFSKPYLLDKSIFNKEVNLKDSSFFYTVNEYERIGERLPKNVLLAVKNYGYKQFKFSAFMGVRTWNECNTYAHGTINDYTPIIKFLETRSFIPEFISAKPNEDDFSKAFGNFMNTYVPDTINLENAKLREDIYNELVFGNMTNDKTQEVLRKTGITHIEVDKKDLDKINNWVKGLKKIEGKTINIYSCLPI